jgi:hypothetical protein
LKPRHQRLWSLSKVESQTFLESSPIHLSNSLQQKVCSWTLRLYTTTAAPDTAISIEGGYEYSVWASYAEIYNERVFDLLGKQDVLGKLQKSTSNFLSSGPRTGPTNSRIPHQYSVRRKALSLKSDGYGGKYIAGLRELHCRTRQAGPEARATQSTCLWNAR